MFRPPEPEATSRIRHLHAGHVDLAMLLSLVAPLAVLVLLGYAADPVRSIAAYDRLNSYRIETYSRGVLQVSAFTVAIWSALTACLLLLLARIWLWRTLPGVQRVRRSRSQRLCCAPCPVRQLVAEGEQQMLQGTIAFFHPFADGGGGGERVLWCASACSTDVQMPPTLRPPCMSICSHSICIQHLARLAGQLCRQSSRRTRSAESCCTQETASQQPSLLTGHDRSLRFVSSRPSR